MIRSEKRALALGGTVMAAAAMLGLAVPAQAQYRHRIGNEMGKCTSAGGPALMVTVDGVKASQGTIRVQSYRATSDEWLSKGKWLSRIEVPAKAGTMTFCVPRVQSYRATSDEWLSKGKWLSRIEVPAKAGTMTFCVPVPGPGTYGIAVRHDVNNNGKTDLTEDGGAMSNNPSINIFNLGKPSYTKIGVPVGDGVKSIRIQMKYM
ncbi:DUF2141 domain-containing protein [Novosphingobium sp. 1949]|uniref:DUF2141 domain-containing protein n=1 Tax=Novosphingobium organovorum TaxID=2930092 RepID=A0ABT0BD01_9SPHN|nr:DUF2141 domain-containing protein [Novosphingobium organovorum]MCJ2182733.1 DUF2141 domain-containing protein [Novosphingobium organovorum]